MRVISQDGKFDIPYDEIVVEIFDKCVVGRLKEYIGRDIILGSYSTEVKAKKAMEMLKEEYMLEKLFETLCSGMGDYPNKPFYYFQFPRDEDVEVENET